MAGRRRKKEREAAEAAAMEAAEDAFGDLMVDDPDEPTEVDMAPRPLVLDAPRRRYVSRRYERDPAVMAEILERLSAGDLVKDICSDARREVDPGFPPAYVVYGWCSSDPDDFGAQFKQARRAGLDIRAEKLVEIAADEARDFQINDKGRIVFNGHAVRRAETIINTEKWLLSKMAPDTYGDRVELKHSGGVNLEASADDLAAQLVKLMGPDGAAAMAASMTIDGTSQRMDDDGAES
jgi:hypothetical protein